MLHLQKKLQGSRKFHISSEMFAQQALGEQPLLVETTSRHRDGDCKGFELDPFFLVVIPSKEFLYPSLLVNFHFYWQALQSAGVNSFESMAAADPRKIEIVTGRKYPFGNHIKESLLLLPPKVEIKIEESECTKAGKLKLIITLYRTSQSATSNRHHFADIVCSNAMFCCYACNLAISQLNICMFSVFLVFSYK